MTRTRIALAIAGLTLAALAAQAPAASALTVNCSQKRYTFLFWPHGHRAVPSVNFPAYPVPHLEFYKPGASYPNSNSLGYIDSSGQGGFSNKCAKVARGSVGSKVSNAASTTSQTALKCSFPRSPRLDLTPAANHSSVTFNVFLGKNLVTTAKIARAGSKLTFNSGFCKKSASPH